MSDHALQAFLDDQDALHEEYMQHLAKLEEERRFYLHGDNYRARHDLKRVGCRFDPERKEWYAETRHIYEEAKRVLSLRSDGMEELFDPMDFPDQY